MRWLREMFSFLAIIFSMSTRTECVPVISFFLVSQMLATAVFVYVTVTGDLFGLSTAIRHRMCSHYQAKDERDSLARCGEIVCGGNKHVISRVWERNSFSRLWATLLCGGDVKGCNSVARCNELCGGDAMSCVPTLRPLTRYIHTT